MLAKIGLNILGCKEVANKHVRDFLHNYLPNQAQDKSSSACWARMSRVLQFGRKEGTMHLYTCIAMNDPVSLILMIPCLWYILLYCCSNACTA